MKSNESHMFYIPELCYKFLVSGPLFVEPDIVYGDVDGVDEGDGDRGGVETGQVQPQHQIATWVDLDGADLERKIFSCEMLLWLCCPFRHLPEI